MDGHRASGGRVYLNYARDWREAGVLAHPWPNPEAQPRRVAAIGPTSQHQDMPSPPCTATVPLPVPVPPRALVPVRSVRPIRPVRPVRPSWWAIQGHAVFPSVLLLPSLHRIWCQASTSLHSSSSLALCRFKMSVTPVGASGPSLLRRSTPGRRRTALFAGSTPSCPCS